MNQLITCARVRVSASTKPQWTRVKSAKRRSPTRGTWRSTSSSTRVKKTHECEVCEKRFTESGSLKKHMLTHTGETPFHCNLCYRSFNQKCNLNAHMLIHTGLKVHQCVSCDKTFTERSALNKHVLIHTGEKPHTCRVCRKSFGRRDTLTTHMLIHIRLKQCQWVFLPSITLKGKLKNHFSRHSVSFWILIQIVIFTK